MASVDVFIAAGSLHLQRPWVLIALLSAALPWALGRRAGRRGRRVTRISLGLQTLSVATLVVALAGPQVPAPSADAPVLLVQDVSGSVRNQPAWSSPVDLPVRTVTFARSPAMDASARLDANATKLAPALRVAAAHSPAPRAILVRTDGRFHDDWTVAADALAARDVPLAVLPMPAPPADARLAAFAARRNADGNVALRVTVAANAALTRTLTIRRAWPREKQLARRPITLRAGDRATTRVTVELPTRQGGAFEALITPADAFPENDSLAAAVLPVEHRTALVTPAGGRWLAGELDDVEVLSPEDAAALSVASPYSAVVVVDPSGETLPPPARQAAARYVHAGGGLVMVGSGPRLSPADANDPLSAALPLSYTPWKRSQLDVRVLLDASGSMGQDIEDAEGRLRRKFDQTVEALLAMGRHLTPTDRLTVWTFADAATKRYSSGPHRPDFATLRSRLGEVRPAGATDAGKALAAAVKAPVAADANGLVVLLTDLQTRPLEVDTLAEAFRATGQRLAIVAAGDAPKTHEGAIDLRQLADRTGASLVQRRRLAGLAKVFGAFVKRSRQDAVAEGEFTLASDGPIFGLSPTGWPTVRRYLRGRARNGAQTLLTVSTNGDPVAARWQVGAGRTVNLALLGDRLAPDARWRGLVAAGVRWARRPGGDPRFAAEGTRRNGTLALEVTADDPDTGPMNDLSLLARVVSAGDASADACSPVPQAGPGRYRVTLRCPPGPVYLAVTDGDGATVLRQAVGGAVPREFAALGADRARLRELAGRAGGRVIVRESELAEFLQRARSRGWRDVTWLALLAATAVMLMDWVFARVTRRGR
jgi:hypothetical protein